MCVWKWGGEKGGMRVSGGGGRARKLAGAATWNCKVGGGGRGGEYKVRRAGIPRNKATGRRKKTRREKDW